MLQPRDIFKSVAKVDIPILVPPKGKNCKFWVIPISNYADLVLSSIDENIKDKHQKKYLKMLVNACAGEKIEPHQLKAALKDSKLSASTVAKDFGEVLAPLFALRYLDRFMKKDGVKASSVTLKPAYGTAGKKLNNICFPDLQNYPIFDFFVQNGYYFGFSVKKAGGASNTLSPTYVVERIKKLPEKAQKELKKSYPVEFTMLHNLSENTTYAGAILAFKDILKTPGNHFDGIGKIRKIFAKTDFDTDSSILERNKETPISKLELKDRRAYAEFMNEYIIDSTENDAKTIQKYKDGTLTYNPTNIVSGFIKYLSMVKLDLKPIMRELFPDLSITKVEINSSGVPVFKMVTLIKLADTIQEDALDLRSKASFNRVNDKLGIQL